MGRNEKERFVVGGENMEVTYMVIVTLVTLIAGAITKTFVDVVPNKFIPLQNL